MKKYLFYLFAFSSALSVKGQSDLFFVTTQNMEILKARISTCTTVSIGFTDTLMTDIALSPDLRLYGTDGYHLYEIDTASANKTFIAFLGLPGYINSLVSDSVGNLYTVAANNVYRINRFTGASVNLGYFGNYSSAGDLAFYKDTLYLSANANQLVKIILSPTLSSILVGTMPSTSMYGINTICYNNANVLIASGGSSTSTNYYQVNTSNASLTPICISIVSSLVYGGASALDFEGSVNCGSTTGLNNVVEDINFSIYPNPVTSKLTVETKIESGYYEFRNLQGELLISDIIRSPKFEIELSLFNSGIYFFTAGTSQSSMKFHKVVVKE